MEVGPTRTRGKNRRLAGLHSSGGKRSVFTDLFTPIQDILHRLQPIPRIGSRSCCPVPGDFAHLGAPGNGGVMRPQGLGLPHGVTRASQSRR
jgi:hypothetical protein